MVKRTKAAATAPMAEDVARSSAGLRDALFDEIDSLRQGRTLPARANAVAKLATVVIESVRMELEVAKHAKQQPDAKTAKLGAPIEL